jgi:hypothetical protein
MEQDLLTRIMKVEAVEQEMYEIFQMKRNEQLREMDELRKKLFNSSLQFAPLVVDDDQVEHDPAPSLSSSTQSFREDMDDLLERLDAVGLDKNQDSIQFYDIKKPSASMCSTAATTEPVSPETSSGGSSLNNSQSSLDDTRIRHSCWRSQQDELSSC